VLGVAMVMLPVPLEFGCRTMLLIYIFSYFLYTI
jgi:hypothetical protein